MNPDIVDQMYRRNPILRYTQHPLHSPLLPLPYGEVTSCECNSEKNIYLSFSLKGFLICISITADVTNDFKKSI